MHAIITRRSMHGIAIEGVEAVNTHPLAYNPQQ